MEQPPSRQRPEAEGGADLSAELVRRIQSGDTSAWETLYLRVRDPLLFSIRCRLGPKLRSRLTSEDVFHSVVKDVMRDLASFESRGPGSLTHFLHACVLNKIRNKSDYFDALKRQGTVPLSDSIAERLAGTATEVPGYLDSERYDRLERALEHLPDAMREVVILRLVEGLSNAEAAQAIDKSIEAASKLYNRALARLGTLAGE